MPYLAKKVCKFGGQNYYIGETIPDVAIDPKRVPTLIEMGKIVKVKEAVEPEEIVEPEEAPEAFDNLTKKELVEIAKQQFDIELDDKMKKEDMIAILKAASEA